MSVLTETLSAWIAGMAARPLPAAVAARTGELVLDGTGALVAACHRDVSTGRRIAAFVRAEGGQPRASVVGQGFKSSLAGAALANGTMGYACDVEPHHPQGILHPIAVMVPAALALAEHRDLSGEAFLKAVAVGCEVTYRLSIALGPAEQYALGFHPSAVCGCFGAAAAAATLLGLDEEAVERALGLAACQASGLMAWESDASEHARPFQMGMAARNGITAALLAADGFGGPRRVFDGAHSPFHAFSRDPSPQRLVEALGERFDGIMQLAIKPYPCVAFLHPALDLLARMMAAGRIEVEHIRRLTMRFARAGIHCVDGNPLKSHCAQYVLAVAAAGGGLQVRDLFVDRRESDRAVRETSGRIAVEADDGELAARFPEAYATELVLELASGEVRRGRNDVARGYPQTPLRAEEIDSKFRGLVGSVADPERTEQLFRTLRSLASLPTVRPLADQLRTIRAEHVDA